MLHDQLIDRDIRLNDRPVGEVELGDLTNAGSGSGARGVRRCRFRGSLLAGIIGAIQWSRVPNRVGKVDRDFAQRVAFGRGIHVDARSKDESIEDQAGHDDMRHCGDHIGDRSLRCLRVDRKNGNRQGRPHTGI